MSKISTSKREGVMDYELRGLLNSSPRSPKSSPSDWRLKYQELPAWCVFLSLFGHIYRI